MIELTEKKPGPMARRLAKRLVGKDLGGVLRPPPPPACPPGWRLGPPDFVGIGAQRCGTTRWFHLLASHDDIVPSPAAKELHYFDRFYAGEFTAADAAGYQRYFPREGGRKTGEWTPLYIASPWVALLLSEAAPDVRLLVLLRDPVERYVSGLQHSARIANDAGLPISQHAPVEAFARGFYHAQLSCWLEHFDRSRLLVLQYERCIAEPLRELRRTLAFVGLSDTGFAPDLDAHPNRQASKPTFSQSTRDALVSAYSEDVTRLASSFPEIDLGLWRNFV